MRERIAFIGNSAGYVSLQREEEDGAYYYVLSVMNDKRSMERYLDEGELKLLARCIRDEFEREDMT